MVRQIYYYCLLRRDSMQLINSQYKVKKHLSEDLLGNTVLTEDVYNGTSKNLRIITDSVDTRDFIAYMKRNMPEYRNLVHPNICRTYFFNKIISIDNRSVSNSKYYHAYQAITGDIISIFSAKSNFEQKLEVFYQLLSAVKFLHTRGFLLCNVNPGELFVEEIKREGENHYNLLITSLPYLEYCSRNERIDKENQRFIPPESFQFGNFTRISDIYLIGEICFYIFFAKYRTNNSFSEDLAAFDILIKNKDNNVISPREESIYKIIKKSVSAKMMDRYHSVEEIHSELNRVSGKNENVCNRALIQNLPENITSQVGREQIINKIVKRAYGRLLSENNKMIVLVKGEKGTGKSALLKTLTYRFSQEGFNVSSEDASLNLEEDYFTIKSVIRNIRKYSTSKVLDKYNIAVNEILSELIENRHVIEDDQTIHNDNIHKVSQFIQEISELVPLVICIDNIEQIDEKSLAILYHLVNTGNGKVFMVLTYGTFIAKKKKSEHFLNSIKERGIAEEFNIGNLSISETGEYIRLLLSMDRIPQELTSSVYKVTNGNPAAIYEIIYRLVSEEVIFINDFCEWDIKKLGPKDLNFSIEGSRNLIEKLKLLSTADREILEKISVFNIPVNTIIINKVCNESIENLSSRLRKLESAGFLIQKGDDRGNVFSFANNNFKISLYEDLSIKNKKKYHKQASIALEEFIGIDEKMIEDEIIYHKTNFGKDKDVIDYLLDIGDQSMLVNDCNSAIKHYSRAVELLSETGEKESYIKLKFKLGRIYEGISEVEKAISMFREAKQTAYEIHDIISVIDVDLCMIDIFIYMGMKNEARKHLLSAKNILRKNPIKNKEMELLLYTAELFVAYKKFKLAELVIDSLLTDGKILEHPEYIGIGYTIKGKLLIDKGNLSGEVESMLVEAQAMLEKGSDSSRVIKCLNVLGIYYDYSGYDEKAIGCYEKALSIGDKVNNLAHHVRLYNNKAEIYRKQDKNKEAIALYFKAINLKGSEYNAIARGVNSYNLAITYTEMEYLSESVQYRDVYESFLKAGQGMEFLEEFHLVHLSQFYYQLGDFEKSIQYADAAEVLCQKWGIASDLEAKMYKILGESSLNKHVDFSNEMALLQNAVERKSYKIIRLICIRQAVQRINEGKIEKGKELYILGMKYVKEIDSEMLSFYYALIEAYFYEGSVRLEYLLKLSERVDRVDGFDLKRMLYTAIGNAYSQAGDLRRGMYFYAIALNYLRKGLKHVPFDQREIYLNSHFRYIVKEQIIKTAEKLFSKGMITKAILNDINKNFVFKKNHPERYFDFVLLRKICLVEEVVPENIKQRPISDLESLTNKITESLSGNPVKNLSWYIEVLTKFCHGTNGFIVDCHGEENQELISSYGRYTKKECYISIMEKVLQTQEVYFIQDVHNFSNKDQSLMVGEETSSIVCIPIIEDSVSANDWVFDKRKKNLGRSSVLGFVFIESESIINNITLETIDLCKKTSKICHLLMDNMFLHEMVSVDRLTQLFSRKHFEAALAIEIEKMIRVGGVFSLVMCDVDKFKAVNDSFGHQMGDEILRKVSKLIMGSVRTEDICSRYGGEEIVILLPGADSEVAINIAEKMRMKIEGAKLLGTHRPLTISIGVATCPDHSSWANDLIEKADQALYFAKESGRNRSVLYSETLTSEPKRIDKLAGIVSGELISDQRSVETLLEIVHLSRDKESDRKDKLFQFLGRVIEAAEADFGIIIEMDKKGIVEETMSRKKLEDRQSEDLYYSSEILMRSFENGRGEYAIDWGNYPGMDKTTGMPDWQSVIVTPILGDGDKKIILYLSVSLRNKEFTGDVYNFVKTLCDMISAI